MRSRAASMTCAWMPAAALALCIVAACAPDGSAAPAGHADPQPAAPRGAGAAGAPDRPNVIVILADDLGWAEPSCYGNTDFETPHIDRLARRGARFTDFYASAPVCLPTRYGLLTGRYQNRDGVDGNNEMRTNEAAHRTMARNLPRLLGQAGYATGMVGKWHIGSMRGLRPTDRGFGSFRGFLGGFIDYAAHTGPTGKPDWYDGEQLAPEPGYATHLITRHALAFIEEHADEPFFLYVAHAAPHWPFQGPGDGPLPAGDEDEGGLPERTDLSEVYREMVTELDRGVGEILDTVDRLGLAQRTLILFLSDNGPRSLGRNGPLSGYKMSLWEGGIRVPAIACWPGRIAPGTVLPHLGMTIDVAPTVLAAAGVPVPPGVDLDGRDLLPALLGDAGPTDRTLFWVYLDPYGTYRAAVRDGPWKLVLAMRRPMLFDLAADPGETRDLAENHPERVAAMLAAFAAWDAETNAGAYRQAAQPAY